jgi:haloalkane dehalogenase
MREFLKSMTRFSWAMSMFGVRQVADVFNPRIRSQDSGGATGAFDEVSAKVAEQLGESLRQTFEAGDRVQAQMLDVMFGFWPGRTATTPANVYPSAFRPLSPGNGVPMASPAIFAARSTANEDVLITFTRGRGRFSRDKRYIALQNTLYNLDGRKNGRHEGVWNALFQRPEDLLQRPGVPVGPMNEPVGPVEAFPVSANTIAKWVHADGSSISSVGPAASHLIPLADGSFLFLVITAQVITQGTGRFAGARGLTQSLGATHVEKGVDLFGGSVDSFPALTLDTFKLRRTVQPPFEPTARGGSTTPACVVSGPESKFANVRGSHMHYLEQGQGEPIVFLHGNPASSYLWRNVVPIVAANARCIVPDLIGMGRSDKPPIEYSFFDHVKYVEGLLDQLGLDRYTLVLHDWGCIIGFYHAMRNERKVRGLAFMEAMFKPYPRLEDFPEKVQPVFKMFRTPEVGYQKIVEENMFIEQVVPTSMIRKLTPEEMEEYRRPFRDPPSRKVIWQFANQLPIAGQPEEVWQAATDYARWLKGTKLPKLLLWARPGLITTKKDVDWARRNLKNLEDKCVGEGIHFHQEDQPAAIGRRVAEWHAKLRQTGSST